jgi:ElaB/YqjD/DUF883 family membrane-anchored ribosome-binding protein
MLKEQKNGADVHDLRNELINVIEKMNQVISGGGSVSSEQYKTLKIKSQELRERIAEFQNQNP